MKAIYIVKFNLVSARDTNKDLEGDMGDGFTPDNLMYGGEGGESEGEEDEQLYVAGKTSPTQQQEGSQVRVRK